VTEPSAVQRTLIVFKPDAVMVRTRSAKKNFPWWTA